MTDRQFYRVVLPYLFVLIPYFIAMLAISFDSILWMIKGGN